MNFLPLTKIDQQNYDSFCQKIDKYGRENETMTQCWKTTASLSAQGYGQMWCQGKLWQLHRFSYWIHNGQPELVKGMDVSHKCDNKECCNPEHLEYISHRQNCLDAVERIREVAPKKEVKKGNWSHVNQLGDQSGENNVKAKLDWERVREMRADYAANKKYGYLTKLAKKYGIAYTTAQKIVDNSLWKE